MPFQLYPDNTLLKMDVLSVETSSMDVPPAEALRMDTLPVKKLRMDLPPAETFGVDILPIERLRMDTLPPEILGTIFEHLNVAYDRSNMSAIMPLIHTTEDVKSMRLCCNQFAQIGTVHLFREVCLFVDKDSIARLKLIAKHPVYRHMVRKLIYFPRFFCNDLSIQQSYGGRLHTEGYEYDKTALRIRTSLFHTPTSEYELPKLSTQKPKEKVFLRKSMVQEELDAFRKIVALLPGILESFTGLNTVTTGFFRSFLGDQTGFFRPVKFRGLVRTIHRYPDSGPACQYLTADGSMLIKAIFKAHSNLTSLFLSSHNQCADIEWEAENFESCSQVFRGLKHLSIGLADGGNVLEAAGYGELLGLSRNLETLVVMTPLSHGNHSIDIFEDVLGRFRRPSLKHLSLQNLTLGVDQLIALVQRHSLESLDLRGIILATGSWFQIFRGIRHHRPVELTVWGLQLFNFGEKEKINADWDEEVPRLLKDFILLGQPWSWRFPKEFKKAAS